VQLCSYFGLFTFYAIKVLHYYTGMSYLCLYNILTHTYTCLHTLAHAYTCLHMLTYAPLCYWPMLLFTV